MKVIFEENITGSYKETYTLGKEFAEEIIKKKQSSKAIVLGLEGELGAGKTAFTQGFAKGLKIKDRVMSPTFVIMNVFDIKSRNYKHFYHFDCYRINNSEEIINLDFKEVISNPENIVCIEWPERIKNILPDNTITIVFTVEGENKRKIRFLDYGKR